MTSPAYAPAADDERAPNTPRWGTPRAAWPIVLAVAVLVAVAVGLWVQARPWSSRTANSSTRLGALSAVAGLAGTVMLSTTLVLSARLRFIELGAGGLDRVYRLHHRLGALSFTSLALHPVLLSWRYAEVSWTRAAQLWRPWDADWLLLSGQIALYGMAAGMVVTLYTKVRHQTLLWTQRFLGVLFIPAALHVMWIGGDARQDPALRWYLAVVVACGMVALVVHTFAGRLLTRHHHYRVSGVRALGSQITEIRLAPVGRSMHFVAGQFAFLRFAHQPIGGESHPYSLASAPTERELRFTIKHLGDYTDHVGDIDVGAQAVVEGPYGRFSHRFVRGRRQAWIAGGIGVAPFLAMARSVDPATYDVTMFYGYNDDGPAAVLDELTDLAAGDTRLRLVAVDERVDGLIDVALLRRTLGSLDDVEFLLCGPPPMLHALQRQLAEAGVAARRVHFEEFDFA